ncbi:hypothetical protein KQ945_14355 [Bacillus subtilis subsp. subtilis]|nr:hypothetical protein [Bacillus subtilis subsp. subtilis]
MTIGGTPSLRRLVRIALCALMLVALSSCNYLRCGEYYTFVNNKEKAAEILAWADTQIIGHRSAPFKITGGLLVGPGQKRVAGLPQPPAGLAGSEVRILQEGDQGVSAIFLGRRTLKGLLITRDAMPGALQGIHLSGASIYERGGRTAVMCFHQR